MSSAPSTDLSIDFVLVTALEEERDALLDKLPGYRKLPPLPDDIRTYYQAELPVAFPDSSKGEYSIIVMPLLGMGRVQAATATSDAIRRWSPRYVVLVGIAGGIAARHVKVGDILIADQIVDYELQKQTPDSDEVRWEVHRVDQRLLNACRNFTDESWQASVGVKRPVRGKSQCHTGPIASGDKVIAYDKMLEKYQNVWAKLVGVEMEAGGVAAAAFQSAATAGFFMIRSVSDLADKDKNSPGTKKWRPYARNAAAAFAVAFLKSGPVVCSQPPATGDPRSASSNQQSISDPVPDPTLRMARRALEILEQQVAGYTVLTIPVHLKLELEAKRREVAKMEARLVRPVPPRPAGGGNPSTPGAAPAADAPPGAWIDVPGTSFKIARRFVTNREFKRFVEAKDYRSSEYWGDDRQQFFLDDEHPDNWCKGSSALPDDPVVEVNWYEACAYCRWLGKREKRNYRLPRDKEWQSVIGQLELSDNLCEWMENAGRHPGSRALCPCSEDQSDALPGARLDSIGFRVLWGPKRGRA